MSVAASLQAVSAKPQAPGPSVGSALLQRKCACGSSKSPVNETRHDDQARSLQKKLAVGASNDPLEQEADRIADQVLARPARLGVSGAPPRIQRYVAQATEECRIHFSKGTDEFTDFREFARCLEAAKDFLKGDDATRVVELHGFASEEGDEEFNRALSQRRADTVLRLLVAGGVPKTRLKTTPHGEDKTYPILEKNRRVEVRNRQEIQTQGVTITGLPCPPKVKTKVGTLDDYQTLLACAPRGIGAMTHPSQAMTRRQR